MSKLFRDLNKYKKSVKGTETHTNTPPSPTSTIHSTVSVPFTPLTQDSLSKTNHGRKLFESLVVENYHTVLVGKAGSMKTSIALVAGIHIAKNTEKHVHYWPFDSSLETLQAVLDIAATERILKTKFFIPQQSSLHPKSFEKTYSQMNEEDLKKIVIMIDTLGYLIENILDKNTVKSRMEFLRSLIKRGTTILSLMHPNKNNENYAGTAEIEQLSDALVKTTLIKSKNFYKVAINELGRVRYPFKPMFFKIPIIDKESEFETMRHTLKHLKTIDYSEYSAMEEKSIIESEREFMEVVQTILRRHNGELNQSKLYELLKKELDYSKHRIMDLLNHKYFIDKFWKIERQKKHNTKLFILIDHSSHDDVQKISNESNSIIGGNDE